jgi:3-oxoacyl-[acyl-carrier protein] reductase
MDVTDCVAIVTGASSGVGRELSISLAQKGVTVVINYAHSEAGAQGTLDAIEAIGGRGMIHRADVSVDAECRALVAATIEAYGQLDILVNNAGTTTHLAHQELDLLSDEIWQSTLGVNLMGPFYMSRAAAPYLKKQGGEIVMTSSVAGFTTGGSSIAYCASKAGLNSLTRCLAKVFGGSNIRVNAVCPGLIDGSWAQDGWGEAWESVKTMVEGQSALGKIVSPADVAEAIMSLICGSDLVTGQLQVLDAGYTIP